MAIKTVTVLKCDGCGCELAGCKDGHANREANTLAKGRQQGWLRQHTPSGQVEFRDVCPDCQRSQKFKAVRLPSWVRFIPWPRMREAIYG